MRKSRSVCVGLEEIGRVERVPDQAAVAVYVGLVMIDCGR